MASKADRARAKKAKTVAAVTAARENGPAAVTANAAATGAATSASRRGAGGGRDDGLDMLLAKRRITRAQGEVGRHYGMLWRTAQIADGAPIRAVDLAGAGGGGMGAMPDVELDHAAWIADCRAGLARAHAALNHHEEMIATLNLICGAGVRPREITTAQRETEQIETALRLGLDILGRHFRDDVARLRAARAAE